eukprot:INCI4189.2.p1 GENE.INCI4189.2~~INCI4189.2.p1  ORF type:complete len:281 (+),score=41.25 INCI4189.2:106-948(+)
MSFSFNFVIDEDVAGDSEAAGGSAEAQLIGTTKPVEQNNEPKESSAVPDLVPGKRLVLDSDSDTALEMKVPSSKLVIRLNSAASSDAQAGGGGAGAEFREFIKVDEERAAIGDHLLNLLYDDDTQTHKDLVPRQYEGGLKVWEASLDLVRYLHRMKTVQRHPLFELSRDRPVPDQGSDSDVAASASKVEAAAAQNPEKKRSTGFCKTTDSSAGAWLRPWFSGTLCASRSKCSSLRFHRLQRGGASNRDLADGACQCARIGLLCTDNGPSIPCSVLRRGLG